MRMIIETLIEFIFLFVFVLSLIFWSNQNIKKSIQDLENKIDHQIAIEQIQGKRAT